MRRTFVDAGVLVDAARGRAPQAEVALRVLEDPTREFIASPFLRLELLPKAVYHRNSVEVRFYSRYLRSARFWADDLPAILKTATREANRSGLNALDALHVAAAHLMGADELITTEKPHRPLHRNRLVRTVWLYAL